MKYLKLPGGGTGCRFEGWGGLTAIVILAFALASCQSATPMFPLCKGTGLHRGCDDASPFVPNVTFGKVAPKPKHEPGEDPQPDKGMDDEHGHAFVQDPHTIGNPVTAYPDPHTK